MSATNRIKRDGPRTVRADGDFYRTPTWVTKAILPYLPRPPVVRDAGAGDGAILEVIRDAYEVRGLSTHNVLGVELSDSRAALAREDVRDSIFIGDFLRIKDDADLIISNPPYSLAQEFAERALAQTSVRGGTVAMLLRLAFLEGQKRAAFHRQFPSDAYVLPKRPSFTGEGTDSAAYAWFVWSPSRGGRWSILDIGSDE